MNKKMLLTLSISGLTLSGLSYYNWLKLTRKEKSNIIECGYNLLDEFSELCQNSYFLMMNITPEELFMLL